MRRARKSKIDIFIFIRVKVHSTVCHFFFFFHIIKFFLHICLISLRAKLDEPFLTLTTMCTQCEHLLFIIISVFFFRSNCNCNAIIVNMGRKNWFFRLSRLFVYIMVLFFFLFFLFLLFFSLN